LERYGKQQGSLKGYHPRKHGRPSHHPLLIVFTGPLHYFTTFEPPAAHEGKLDQFKYLHKAGKDFGAYLGARPHPIKVGIFRDVVLDTPAQAWIGGVWRRARPAPYRHRLVLENGIAPEFVGLGERRRRRIVRADELSQSIRPWSLQRQQPLASHTSKGRRHLRLLVRLPAVGLPAAMPLQECPGGSPERVRLQRRKK
jgi:hypothetical protein